MTRRDEPYPARRTVIFQGFGRHRPTNRAVAPPRCTWVQHFATACAILPQVPDRGNDETLGGPALIWLGHDPVSHLRVWETEQVYPMPEGGEVVIGSAADVTWQLVDPGRSVSRRHARVFRVEGGWEIEDLHSRYGIRCDGGRATSKRFLITPGMEIGIGGITLIAENATLVRLRHYLARVLGWDLAHRSAIDLAMRAVRGAALRRGSLVLAGADDLVPVARQIHLLATPPNARFLVFGKLLESDASLRLTATTESASAAIEQAAGGTVCVRADKPPDGYDDLVDATFQPQAMAQLYQCTKKVPKRAEPTARGIVIVPKLADSTLGRHRSHRRRVRARCGPRLGG